MLKENRRLHAIIITALILISFANTLPNRFNIDDPSVLLNNKAVHGLSIENIRLIFTAVPNSVEYLPIRDLTYCLDYELWGLNPSGYHLSSLLYYIASCLMLYAFLIALLEKLASGAALTAFVASALFAVHPVHVESVAGIAQRKDLVSGLFYFASLWSYVRFKTDGRNRYLVLSIFSFIFAMLSKMTAVTLPLIIVMLEFVYPDKKRNVFIPAVYILAAIVLSAVGVSIASGTGIIAGSENPLYRIPTALMAVVYYLKILIFPFPLRLWHDFGESVSIFDSKSMLSAAALLFAAYLIYRKRRTSPVLSFSGAWYLVSAAPVSGLIPTSTVIAERYLFLPSAGFVLGLAWIIEKLFSGRRAYLYAAVISIVAIYSAISVDRNRDWYNNETLILADLRNDPASKKLNRTLGRYYFQNGRYEEAFRLFRRLKELNGKDMEYDFFSAYYMFKQGRHEEALSALDSIRKERGGVVDVYYLYGRIYEALGRYDEAKLSYENALRSRKISGIFFKSDALRALDALNKRKAR